MSQEENRSDGKISKQKKNLIMLDKTCWLRQTRINRGNGHFNNYSGRETEKQNWGIFIYLFCWCWDGIELFSLMSLFADWLSVTSWIWFDPLSIEETHA